jgi:hypothetical protein
VRFSLNAAHWHDFNADFPYCELLPAESAVLHWRGMKTKTDLITSSGIDGASSFSFFEMKSQQGRDSRRV